MSDVPISPGLPFMGKFKLGILAKIPFNWGDGNPYMHGPILSPAPGRDYPTFNQDPNTQDQAASLIFYGTLDRFKPANVDGDPLTIKEVEPSYHTPLPNYVLINDTSFSNLTTKLANYNGGTDGS
jgi:hypothetical protein